MKSHLLLFSLILSNVWYDVYVMFKYVLSFHVHVNLLADV